MRIFLSGCCSITASILALSLPHHYTQLGAKTTSATRALNFLEEHIVD
jgi:hypothetical protein